MNPSRQPPPPLIFFFDRSLSLSSLLSFRRRRRRGTAEQAATGAASPSQSLFAFSLPQPSPISVSQAFVFSPPFSFLFRRPQRRTAAETNGKASTSLCFRAILPLMLIAHFLFLPFPKREPSLYAFKLRRLVRFPAKQGDGESTPDV